MNDQDADAALDAVLRASGSALKHYTIALTRERQRAAMRNALSSACHRRDALLRQALDALERGRPQIMGALVQQDQDAAIRDLREAMGQAAQIPSQPTHPIPTAKIGVLDDEEG
jgi:hypothetical protein